jgi:hypothetical protein
MTTSTIQPGATVRVADEVWVATALLHREFPKRPDFEIREIVERAAKAKLHAKQRPGVYVHVVQHCVANRRPDPGRLRMLYETRAGHRRLFRAGDDWHPDRKDGRTGPTADALPERYRELLEWYDRWSGSDAEAVEDPILRLRGLGGEIWADEAADKYVARLRSGWE